MPYLCETGQVNQCEVEDVRGVDLEVDGLTVDALVAAGYTRRLVLDLTLDIAKVSEPPVRDVMKLGPLVSRSCSRVPEAGIECVFSFVLGDVDQL